MKAIILAVQCIALLGFGLITDLHAQIVIDLQVTLPDELKADAGYDHQIDRGGWATLGGHPTATGGTGDYFYIWTPEDGLSDPYLANPFASPLSTTTYRLTILDDKGCHANDEVTVTVGALGFVESNLLAGFVIFPNPSHGVYHLQFSQVTEKSTLELRIYNVVGEMIWENNMPVYNGMHPLQIELNAFPDGIYLLQMTEMDSVKSVKLIKE